MKEETMFTINVLDFIMKEEHIRGLDLEHNKEKEIRALKNLREHIDAVIEMKEKQ